MACLIRAEISVRDHARSLICSKALVMHLVGAVRLLTQMNGLIIADLMLEHVDAALNGQMVLLRQSKCG